MPPSPGRWGFARVHGQSMEPTLAAGDRLLVDYAITPRPGDLVVLRLPDRVVAVKRAAVRAGGGWWVERDNPLRGVDSAQVGTIPDADILGVVLGRVWPRPRSRRALRIPRSV